MGRPEEERIWDPKEGISGTSPGPFKGAPVTRLLGFQLGRALVPSLLDGLEPPPPARCVAGGVFCFGWVGAPNHFVQGKNVVFSLGWGPNHFR